MLLVIAGTSDARALSIELKDRGFSLLTTVVTDNAAMEMREAGVNVLAGRLTGQEMASLIEEKGVRAIVDASHPFAEEASRNAIFAAQQTNVPYLRYERESQSFQYEKLTTVTSYEEAAEAALKRKGVIMLTTGSKTLEIFTQVLLGDPEIRLIARMLPRIDNMEKCERLGFPQKNIVAIQGPFTQEFDQALYKQYGVTLMITKESGKVGAVDEKVQPQRSWALTSL